MGCCSTVCGGQCVGQIDRQRLGFALRDDEDASLFHRSNFAAVSGTRFLAYRAIVAIYWTAWAFDDMIEQELKERYHGHWFIYVTNWSAMVQMVYFWLALALSVKAHRESQAGEAGVSLTGLHKATWFFREVIAVSSLMVFIMYWLLVYDPEYSKVTAQNVHVHGINFLLMASDLALAATPMRIAHLWMPMVYQSVYIVFTVIYDVAGGLNDGGDGWVYDVLDWDEETGASFLLTAILLLIVSPLLHSALCGMSYFFQNLSKAEVPAREGKEFHRHVIITWGAARQPEVPAREGKEFIDM